MPLKDDVILTQIIQQWNPDVIRALPEMVALDFGFRIDLEKPNQIYKKGKLRTEKSGNNSDKI